MDHEDQAVVALFSWSTKAGILLLFCQRTKIHTRVDLTVHALCDVGSGGAWPTILLKKNFVGETFVDYCKPQNPQKYWTMKIFRYMVAKIDYQKDSNGKYEYPKLSKPHLVNHVIFYPEKDRSILFFLWCFYLFYFMMKVIYCRKMRQQKWHLKV